jgi:prepilin peptidase CpaA
MTSHLLVNEIAILAFAALLVAAAVEDVRRLIIPNRIPLGIIILYPAYVLSANGAVDWMGAAVLAGGALGVGIILFAFRYAGGGDVKLFVAASLWAGPTLFPSFLLVTSLVGAAFGIGMLAHRRFFGIARASLAASLPGGREPTADTGSVGDTAAPSPARPAPSRELPYGVAIAAGGIQIVVHLLVGG